MDSSEFAKLKEVVVHSTALGVHHVADIKDADGNTIGSIQVPSASHFSPSVIILDDQGSTIARIDMDQKIDSHQAITRIYDSQNSLLATMISWRSEGNIMWGKTVTVVDDPNNMELFRITANFSSGRYGKVFNNIMFMRDGKQVVEHKTSFWHSDTSIFLIEQIDMRIVLASFFQFEADAARSMA